MKILIVDDEQLARERLKDLLVELDNAHQLHEAANGVDALKLIEDFAPEIVLLDIRMPLMDGLETASHLSKITASPAIIFTTAYQDHALQAFDTNAVDYLLKPIRTKRLQEALRRAEVFNRGRIDMLRKQIADNQSRSHLSATHQGKIELIPVTDIRYLKASQKYVSIGRPGRETLVDDSLKSLEVEFRDTFLRIHRNALVALQYVESLEKNKDGSYSLSLQDIAERLLVSRRHLSEVRSALKKTAT